MPLSYEIDRERQLVVVTGVGLLEDAEILEMGETLRADPKLEPEYSELVNYLKADVRQLSADQRL